MRKLYPSKKSVARGAESVFVPVARIPDIRNIGNSLVPRTIPLRAFIKRKKKKKEKNHPRQTRSRTCYVCRVFPSRFYREPGIPDTRDVINKHGRLRDRLREIYV